MPEETHNGEKVDKSQRYYQIYRSRKRMLLDNFLGGLFWSFGTIIGGTILIIVIAMIAQQADIIPGFKDLLQQVNARSNPAVNAIPTPTPSPTPRPTSSPSPTTSPTNTPTSTSSATRS